MKSQAQRNREYAVRVGTLLRAKGYDLKDITDNNAAMRAAIKDFRANSGLGEGVIADAATFEALKRPIPPLMAKGSLGVNESQPAITGQLQLAGNEPPQDNFNDFSPAMQANAVAHSNVAEKLRAMQLAEAQAATNKAALRSSHNDPAQVHPSAPVAPSIDFSFVAPDAPLPMTGDAGSIAAHNARVTLRRALEAHAAKFRDDALTMTLPKPLSVAAQ